MRVNLFEKTMTVLKKTPKVVIAIIVILVLLRAAAPSILKYAVIKSSEKYIPQYELVLGDVDLSLVLGRYYFDDTVLRKREAKVSTPLFMAKRLQFGISWHHLFKGQLRMNVEATEPKVTLSDSDQKNEKQFGQEESLESWTQMLRVVIPLQIVSVKIHEGAVNFENKSTTPPISVALSKTDALFRDISFTEESNEKSSSSPFHINGVLQNHAALKVEGSLIKNPTAMIDLNVGLRKLDLHQLNPFLKHYASLDFTEGDFDFLGEAVVDFDKKKIEDSYGRVFLSNVDVIANNEVFSNFKELAIEFAAAIGNGVLKRKESKNISDVAFEANLKGTYTDLEYSISSIFWSAAKHKFRAPIPKELKNSIGFGSKIKQKPENP